MPARVRASGNWGTVSQPYARVAGSWRSATKLHVRVGGTWSKAWDANPYWFVVASNTSGQPHYPVQMTSDGGAYVITSEATGVVVSYINRSGDVVFSRLIAGTFYQSVSATNGFTVDSNDNLLWRLSYSSTNYRSLLFVISKTGSFSLQRQSYWSGVDTFGQSVSVRPASGTVYVGNSSFLSKLNSSFTHQWSRALSSQGTTQLSPGLAADPSTEQVYCSVYSVSTVTRFITKVDTNGTVLLSVNMGANPDTRKFVVDSSGNLYILASDINGSGGARLVKYNSSLTLQWSKRLQGVNGSSYQTGHSLALDKDGNLIISGEFVISGVTGGVPRYWIKLDPNGNILLARYVSLKIGTASYDYSFQYSGHISPHPTEGAMIFSGYGWNSSSGLYRSFVARLPIDGSGTGTYTAGDVTVTYGSFTPYITTGATYGSTSSAFSFSTLTPTDSNTSYTAVSTSISANRADLP